MTNQAQIDQAELLIHLTKLLEDKTKEKSWNIITARRLILSTLDTHHPHVNITSNM